MHRPAERPLAAKTAPPPSATPTSACARFSGGELRLLPALLRAAALRFWLSRLWDLHLPRDAALLQAKDPTHFERVLRERIERPWHPIH